MHLKDKKKLYLEPEQLLKIDEELANSIVIKASVLFEKNKFLDNQKDLIEEFMAELMDKLQTEESDIEEVKNNFEILLQWLNTKLKAFADQFGEVEFFPIKWYIQLVVDNLFMTSMIGNATIVIFRDHKLYYTLHNGVNAQGKIDLFSDFVEGDVEAGDEILYVWTKISDVIDQHDFKEVESILKSEEVSLIDFIHEVVTSRLDKKHVGFISHYTVQYMRSEQKSGGLKFSPKLGKLGNLGNFAAGSRIEKFKNMFLRNKYQATVFLLSIVIIFMLYSLLSEIISTNKDTVYVTPEGVSVEVTVDDIKKDIFLFQSMDPTGDEKSLKYQEIMTKLTTLESKGRWLEDVAQLQKILRADYYKWFNIIAINNLSQFDDIATGRKTKIMTFNTTEQQKLWDLTNIFYQRDLNIAWTKAALMWAMGENVRWSIVEYSMDEETVKWCNQSLLKDGLYCFTNNGKIFLVNKGGIQILTTGDPDGFSLTIGGLATYGKANLYVFQPNITTLSNSVLVTRYRNTLWSQTIYQAGQKYYLNTNMLTGANFGSGFTNFAIDSTFLVWANGKPYQFRRNPANSFNLDYREIKLLGGDKMTSKYSDNVKIISTTNSRYVYFLDKDNQTFTVYESRPLKTNDQYNTSYNLYYLFRYSFDLRTAKVVDIAIPEATGEKPEMYILTTNGINKVRLYEFIESIKENKVLKQVGSATN